MHCPICEKASDAAAVFTKKRALLSVAALPYDANASAGHGDIELVECAACGFIFNRAFNGPAIQKIYRSDQYSLKKLVSPSMSENLRFIYDHLAPLAAGARVLEAGSGNSAMAQFMAAQAVEVFTMDPSVEAALAGENQPSNLFHINDYFSEESLRSRTDALFDLIVARHLLEHLTEPRSFLTQIRSCLKAEGTAYIEVPNMDEIVESERYYDIFHDHFGYYRQESFNYLCQCTGFTIVQRLYMYEKQHVGYFIKKSSKPSAMPQYHKERNDISVLLRRLDATNKQIDQIPGPISIWGAGAHGNAFLNYLSQTNREKVTLCLDRDRSKSGRYLQDSRAQITYPGETQLTEGRLIVAAASLYEREIVDTLKRSGARSDVLKTATKLELLRLSS